MASLSRIRFLASQVAAADDASIRERAAPIRVGAACAALEMAIEDSLYAEDARMTALYRRGPDRVSDAMEWARIAAAHAALAVRLLADLRDTVHRLAPERHRLMSDLALARDASIVTWREYLAGSNGIDDLRRHQDATERMNVAERAFRAVEGDISRIDRALKEHARPAHHRIIDARRALARTLEMKMEEPSADPVVQ